MKVKLKNKIMTAGLSIMAAGCTLLVGEQKMAEKPPMGWNSFDSYAVYLHEKAALENLEAMAEKLKPYGYEYFVIDNGWFGEYKLMEGTIFPSEKHAHNIKINEYGYVMPSDVYFPNGLTRITERCHELGLKFGIHLMRGIPRKAYELNLPIKGTKYTARNVADTSNEENCRWCKYNYAVDMSKPGAQEWYDGLIQHIADMGVDMIKYDDIVPHPDEVEAVSKAIEKTGKPILLSLSPGGKVQQTEDAIKLLMMGNMLRVTHDIWDDQKGIDQCFAAWRKWNGYSKPGFWIDMDMIPFGNLQLMSPQPKDKTKKQKAVRLSGRGYSRVSQFTKPQMYTFITMRALSASPLMMGGDLPTLDDFSLKLITNKDMLECNQNGVMGTLEYEAYGLETWVTPKKGTDNAGWLGVFNRTNNVIKVKATAQLLGLGNAQEKSLHDVWNEKEIAVGDTLTIESNGAIFATYK